MAVNTSISLVGLDFDTLKSNYKNNLKNNASFRDYDFEGSNMNVLIDLLVDLIRGGSRCRAIEKPVPPGATPPLWTVKAADIAVIEDMITSDVSVIVCGIEVLIAAHDETRHIVKANAVRFIGSN